MEDKPRGALLDFYDKQYKKLLIIPALLLILALIQIGYQMQTTGDFVHKGVSLKGGISVKILDSTAEKSILLDKLNNEFPKADISIRALTQQGVQTALVIEIDLDVNDQVALEKLQNVIISSVNGFSKQDLEENIQKMNPKLGTSFFSAAFRALIIAFVFMGLVVFVYFRTPIPSLAVILAAFSDMVVTLAIFNILDMKLSAAGIAAFLMLIGYSVDTDILLTTKVLKDTHKPIMERVITAAKTGMMMSITTLVAIAAGISFALSLEIQQIMTILFIGLLVDQVYTWIMNVGILRIYLERKSK